MNIDFLTAPDRACADLPTELFMPRSGLPGKTAKAACRRCPYTADCLAYAYATGDNYAYMGGKTANERRAVRPPQHTPLRMQIAGRRRQVVDMAESGFTPKEIALVLKLPVATVTADKARAGRRQVPARVDAALYARIDALDEAGVSPTRIAEQLHIGRRTVYNRRAQRAAEREQVAA